MITGDGGQVLGRLVGQDGRVEDIFPLLTPDYEDCKQKRSESGT
jgi:hypothetical protein